MSGVVVLETLRRHVTNIAYIGAVAFMLIVAIAGSQFGPPGQSWPAFVTLLAIVLGSGVLGPEFSSGTLQLILVKPIRRATYLVSRVTGVVLAVWIAAALCFAVEVIARLAGDEVGWKALGTALVNSMADAVLIVSLLTFFGSFLRAYYSVALYFVILIALNTTLGLGARKLPTAVLDALRFLERNLFPDLPPRFDRDWLLMVVSNAAIAVVLACFVFRRREVPYGAD